MTDQRINVQASFNDNFCTGLEYHLCRTFENSDDKVLKYVWCDGVSEPLINEQFTSRNITSIKQVVTKAWVGKSGNDRYDMIIKLGRCARRRALKGLSLERCLPDEGSLDWIEIDVENLWIVIQLDRKLAITTYLTKQDTALRLGSPSYSMPERIQCLKNKAYTSDIKHTSKMNYFQVLYGLHLGFLHLIKPNFRAIAVGY